MVWLVPMRHDEYIRIITFDPMQSSRTALPPRPSHYQFSVYFTRIVRRLELRADLDGLP